MEPIHKNRNIIHLLIITIIALFLRLFMLGNQSLWLDEAFVYSQIKTDSISEVYSNVMANEGHIGPLYHILNNLFCRLFGYSEWSFRMPSAIYGTIAVILVYIIARALKGNITALFSAVLMAFSPVHVWYSQEARMYSLWVMFILFAVFIFIKILKGKRQRLWILFTIFASLSIWTFLNSVFVFAALGLYLVIFIRRYKKEFCYYTLSVLVALACYYPGIAAILAQGPTTVVRSSRTTTIFDLMYSFYVFNVGTTFGPSLVTLRALLKQFGAINTFWKIFSEYGVLIIPSMLLYGGFFLYSIYRAVLKRKDENFFILIMLFFPIISVFGITFLSSRMPFNIRYILCALPFYIILISIALNELSKRWRLVLFSGMIIFSVLSLFNHYFIDKYSKLDFRTVVKYLNETMTEDDDALIIHEHAPWILLYYDKTDKLRQYYIPPTDSYEIASSIVNRSRRIFYVKSIRTQIYNQEELNKIDDMLVKNVDLVKSVNPALYFEVKIYKRRKDDSIGSTL